MQTRTKTYKVTVPGKKRQKIMFDFDGGRGTSNAGAVAFDMVDQFTGGSELMSAGFTDHRVRGRVEHSVPSLIRQRIMGIALGQPDVADQDELRKDGVIQALHGDLSRTRKDVGAAAGKCTMHRFEHSVTGGKGSYARISHDPKVIERALTEMWLNTFAPDDPPEYIILDIDVAAQEVYGGQEGARFCGHKGCRCLKTQLIFHERYILAGKVRPSYVSDAHDAVDELARVIGQIRDRFPDMRILVRGDCAYAQGGVMDWCEDNKVDFIIGMPGNPRLKERVAKTAEKVRRKCLRRGEPAQAYRGFMWNTKDGWPNGKRRIVAKVEHLPATAPGRKNDKPNPRFVATSLTTEEMSSMDVYADLYSYRGEAENQVKQIQRDLVGGPLSANGMETNQLRFWFVAMALNIKEALRVIGLHGTKFENATFGRIRDSLLKVGGTIKVKKTFTKVSVFTDTPHLKVFELLFKRLYRLTQKKGGKRSRTRKRSLPRRC